MRGDPQAVLITGLFGTGKSSVAIEMADRLEKHDLPYAVIDLDWLCWGWAGGAEGSEHRMMLANLVPIVANYLGAGVRYFIFARSIRTPPELASLRSVLSMPLKVVELTVPLSEIERRLAPEITAARKDDLRDAKTWLEAGEGVGLGDISVPNDRPLRDVASDILGRLGWTGLE
ncbi:MAG: AAA family ATPase [Actinomycetota bacterium]|nr:AAA family ATPase [Actinomycetota bacterium]